jgi:PKD repeat protein
VEFDASLSTDEDLFTLSYIWDFGDGSGAQGKEVNHTYTMAGDYNVKLLVRDHGGLTDAYTYPITITQNVSPHPGPVNGTAAWVYWAGAGIVAAAVALPLALFAVARRRKREESGPAQQPSRAAEGEAVSAAPGEEAQPVVVDRGINYLLDADLPAVAYAALERLTGEGAKALIITPIHPKKVLKMADLKNVEMFWLSDLSGDEPTMDPSKMDYEMSEKIIAFIKEHKEEGVVFIDGLDLLIQRHGYNKVLDFIQGINELASVNEATVLVNVHSKAMKEVEFNQLKRKFDRW